MSKQPIITKKQAERIFDTDMKERDFWFVTDTNDNINILQDVIDILYNSKDGNRYKARYSTGYNCRLIIYCEICRKELMSFDPFISHDSGKHHKKALAITSMSTASNFVEDIVFRDQLTPLGIFKEGSLEDKIDHAEKPVVGLEFVYKENDGSKLLFTCQLCQKQSTFRITDEYMYKHLVIEEYHTLKYMDVAYGFKDAKMKDVQHKLNEIVQLEGKITCNIVLLRYDESYRGPYYKDSERGRSQTMETNRPGSSQSTGGIKRSWSPQEPLTAPCEKRPTLRPKSSETASVACQVNLSTETISEFVDDLKNCVEEEKQITDLLEVGNEQQKRVLTDVIKVLGNGMLEYFKNNKDDEFERMVKKFVEMTTEL